MVCRIQSTVFNKNNIEQVKYYVMKFCLVGIFLYRF
jgi:hypothetical protein